MVKSYKDLQVWQRAIEMNLAVYAVTRLFPKDELFGLVSQLRRASVSVASNIAEGYGRGGRGEYKYFLGIARGSTLEVETQLIIARQLNYGDPAALDKADQLAEEVSKMLHALLRKL